ncbi:unnamed protein product [Trifolium pratense]|uniref:Uncharacterized protein n=1 Tax=Trifolium pratense TaxID=57577 RepID=A0ACB0KF71_TRIPR|nr:unnamed protein product [Trifolium pratense]
MASQQQNSKTIPLKVLVDKNSNKVVFVEATKDFVETIFSFLSLPLATIVRLLATATNNNSDQQHQQSESSPFLGNIKNLYQSVQNINSNDIWSSPACKQMLLRPRNPCESLLKELFLNIDDTESSIEYFVCSTCYKFTTFENLNCTCGNPPNKKPRNLDSESQGNNNQNGVFLRESGAMFLVSDKLKIFPSSKVNSLMMLVESGCSDFTQLEEVTHNIGKQEILNLLKYTLTSHEPLTNTILVSSSKIIDDPPNQYESAVRVMPSPSDSSKMNIKVVQSKSQNKIITIEDNGDFVDFIFSFLTMPLGSIVKLLGANSFAGSGCVGNLYKSVENLDPTSVLLNPGIVPQFGCPNQPLNIPHVQPPPTTYYYGTGTPKLEWDHYYDGYRTIEVTVEGGVISKSKGSIYNAKTLIALDPRPLNSSEEGVVGFLKRTTFYGVGGNLEVKPLSANFCLSYLKELSLPIDDLEVKVIPIGETEALMFLGAFLTSKLP